MASIWSMPLSVIMRIIQHGRLGQGRSIGSRLCLTLLLGGGILAGLLTDLWQPEPSIRNISFSAEQLQMPPAQPLVDQGGPGRLKSIDVSLTAVSSANTYSNIFSTSDGPKAIRLELTDPSNLFLVLGTLKYALLTDAFSLSTPKRISVKGVDKNYLTVSIDGFDVFSGSGEQLDFDNYDIDAFVVGSGFQRLRNFAGELLDLKIKAEVAEDRKIIVTVRRSIALVIVAGLVLLLGKLLPDRPDGGIGKLQSGLHFDAVTLILMLSLASIGSMLRGVSGSSWTLLIMLGGAFPSLVAWRWLANRNRHDAPNFVRRLQHVAQSSAANAAIVSLVIATTILVVFKLRKSADSVDAIVGSIGLIASVASIGVWSGCGCRDAGKIYSVVAIAAAAALLACFLLHLPNGAVIIRQYVAWPFLTLATFGCFLLFLNRAVLGVALTNRRRSFGVRLIANTLSACGFLVLAFRSDSLFIDGSQFHWAYFVGPVQAVRAGGWLLWDVPSQYGLLPIAIISTLPFASAWNAFYVFQAALLFSAALIMYFVLLRVGLSRAIAFLVVAGTVFLADPRGFIGPMPFPSSSVVRFFWCYVVLAVACWTFLGPHPSVYRYLRLCLLPWLIGVLWSAESFVYVTSITFAPVVVHLLSQFVFRRELSSSVIDVIYLLVMPITVLAAAIIGVQLFYLAKLGHLADLSMFFQYALGYAGGFGAMPLSMQGPIWIFLLIMVCGVSCCAAMPGREMSVAGVVGVLIAALACVWAILSYYIGRAVPDNVTALLPLLAFVSLIVARIGFKSGLLSPMSFGFLTTFLALVVASTVLSTSLLAGVPRMRFAFSGITSKLYPPETDLAAALKDAGVTANSAVSFYGYAASMPYAVVSSEVVSYEKPFFFGPFQLLEEPISAAKREIVIRRFVDRFASSGYIVQKRGEAEDRLESVLNLIGRWYVISASVQRGQYRILRLDRDVPR